MSRLKWIPVFRILANPIIGWEGWEEKNGKKIVYRYKNDNKPKDHRPYKDQSIDHFWIMPAWNYDLEMVQLLEIKQKSILNDIKDAASDESWGSPLGYDIKVNKTGEGLGTRYKTTTRPHSQLPEDARKAYDEFLAKKIDLEKLFTGQDQFKTDEPRGEYQKHLIYDDPMALGSEATIDDF